VTVVDKGKEKQKVAKEQGIDSPLRQRLYSLKQASIYLGRGPWGMRELYWSGKIPVVRDGKKIFFDIRDLDNYVEKNKSTYS